MPNIEQLTTGVSSATALGKLILVTVQGLREGYQPQNPPSKNGTISTPPPPIVFHYEGENTVTFKSDITDHYSEDNESRQDQIALKPIMISTNGLVGDLNDVVPGVLAPLKEAAEKLTVVAGYEPQLSAAALRAYNQALFLYSTAKNAAESAVAAFGSLFGEDQQTPQQIYFSKFKGYWSSRTLFTVQTPWAKFEDMAIDTLVAIQSAETRVITDFNVTFKQMRFAKTERTIVGLYDNNFFQGRSATQGSPLNDLGTYTPPLSRIGFTDIIPGRARLR